MKLLIISDLHIGNGDAFGTFGWKQEEFIFILKQLIRKYNIGLVILNGDIYEMYKYTLDQIRVSHRKLVEFFMGEKFIYIKGNHDALHPEGKDFFLMENGAGQTIYIEHGHEADFLNGTSMGRLVSRLVFATLKRLTRWKIFLYTYFRMVEHAENINRIPKRYNTFKYLQYALRLLKTYDVVILGHTHKVETHHTYYLQKKKRYINCGTCSLGRLEGIILETESLRYELIKYSRDQMIINNERVLFPDLLSA